jgi:hypothetical protein
MAGTTVAENAPVAAKLMRTWLVDKKVAIDEEPNRVGLKFIVRGFFPRACETVSTFAYSVVMQKSSGDRVGEIGDGFPSEAQGITSPVQGIEGLVQVEVSVLVATELDTDRGQANA